MKTNNICPENENENFLKTFFDLIICLTSMFYILSY